MLAPRPSPRPSTGRLPRAAPGLVALAAALALVAAGLARAGAAGR